MKPKFFAKPHEFRNWLEKFHSIEDELWVGFHKKNSAKPSLTWPEAVDAALCFGWIDGVRKNINEVSYKIRFTPRRTGSIWSAVNIGRVQDLSKLGLMHASGIAVFEKRKAEKSAIYSYEQKTEAKLGPEYETKFKANKKAWEFFLKQAPWYRRTIIHWVVNAKQEKTRLRRLAQLIEDSANERRVGTLTRTKSE